MYRLNGTFELRTDLGVLRRCNGDEINLRPKTFQTLLFLLRHRNRLVTKDELNAHLWSDTAVTDDALVQCIVELRRALGDDARDPTYIKTAPKLGYRFVGPVEEIAGTPAPVAEPASRTPSPLPRSAETPSRISLGSLSLAMTAVMLIAAVALTNFGANTESAALDPTSGKPGIAVMFLDNQSGAEDAEWMRQGLAEMLITGLSRSDRVNVLGRKHLQTLLDRMNHPLEREIPLDVAREVARRSQAQYLLMGSFARLGDKTRIDVRLESVDAKQVASETLTVDRPEEVLTQVDLLAWKLARYFDTGVARPVDVAASGLTTNLDAYRAYSLGLSKAIAYHNEEAVRLFERALELDPGFVMARARLGYVYGVTWDQASKAVPHLEAAFTQADRLRESDRLYIEAWYALTRTDFVGAIAPLQRLVRLYPYELEAYDRLSRLLQGERRIEEAIDMARRGLLIDPESPGLHNTLGGAYATLGRYADAIASHRRYVALAPSEPNSHDSLGLSLQTAGRYAEAEQAFTHALTLKPDFNVAVAHLANVHLQTGRYRSADRLYARYLALGQTSAERARAHCAMVVIRARHGRFDQARDSAEACDREHQAHRQGAALWGQLTLASELRQPLESMPGRAEYAAIPARGSRQPQRFFLRMAGLDALARGDTAGGLDLLRQALLENPLYWFVEPSEDALALGYMRIERWDDAIAEFGRVLRANPRYPRAHYYLATSYDRKGDRAAAMKAYRDFLDVWSGADADAPEVVDAKARLAKLQS